MIEETNDIFMGFFRFFLWVGGVFKGKLQHINVVLITFPLLSHN